MKNENEARKNWAHFTNAISYFPLHSFKIKILTASSDLCDAVFIRFTSRSNAVAFRYKEPAFTFDQTAKFRTQNPLVRYFR